MGAVHGACAKIAGMEPVTDPTSGESCATPAKDMALLVAGCRQLGVALNAGQQEQFELYYRELVTWNERLNLTTITGYDEVQVKHFLDSLVSLPIIATELGQTLPLDKPLRLVDVGSGAGFPGLPIKIASPMLDVTLMDGTQKKVHFLQQVVDTLQLTSIQIVHGRAEELGRNNQHRDRYDLVTARGCSAECAGGVSVAPGAARWIGRHLQGTWGAAGVHRGTPGSQTSGRRCRTFGPGGGAILAGEAFHSAAEEVASDSTSISTAGRDWRARSRYRQPPPATEGYSSMQPLSR